MSEMLEKARKYEFTQGQQIKAEDRPAFHITPYVGWMNDPNGFSCYKGEYHLFYQYNPYNTHWDSMHWGHVVSKDLLHWDYLPAALAPDQDYDKVGCFSGSAIELEDGRQLLMYTAVDREILEDGTARDVQTQAVAVGDGKDYVKYDKNPVLTFKDLPEGASRVDFRDPKIWKEKDGNFYCVIGSRPADGSGQILLYRSKNGFEWEFVSTLAENKNRYGKMWECPDFFELDGKYVLLTSPQDMIPEGMEYHNGNGTLCIIGDLDSETHTLKEQSYQSVDYGIDCYAMQTLLAPDGRRIMIAWMQNWATAGAKPAHCRWFGQMTLPRELFVQDGRLCQRPVRELDTCQRQQVLHRNIPVSGEVNLPGVQGRVVDMTVTIRPTGSEVYRWFRIHVAKDGTHDTIIRYRPNESTLKIDRTRSGLPHDIVHTRSFLVRPQGGELKLRIILDRFSIEVFVNDGEQAASSVIYTPQQADAITFEAGGQALIDVEKYDLIV